MPEEQQEADRITLATEITVAWLSNPNTRAGADDVPAFLNSMHAAPSGLSTAGAAPAQGSDEAQQYSPAVSVRKSLASPDHIVSMIDGKPYKTLRRHLARHGLTPDQYRQRYGLKADYPMVSESYSQVRRDMAKKIGLGRKTGGGAGNDAEAASQAPEAGSNVPKPMRSRRQKSADVDAS